MRTPLVLALTLALVACSGGSETTVETTPAPSGPEMALDRFVGALADGDLDEAAAATDPRQVTLLAVAEGVSAGAVADFTEVDRQTVLANFWSGFVDQLRASLGTSLDGMRDGEVERFEVGGAQFAAVDLVRSADGSRRRLVVRETDDGWRLDLIAGFPQAFLVLLPGVAQAVRAAGDPELLDDLRGYGTSVEFVLADPDTDPILEQSAIAALEAITR